MGERIEGPPVALGCPLRTVLGHQAFKGTSLGLPQTCSRNLRVIRLPDGHAGRAPRAWSRALHPLPL